MIRVLIIEDNRQQAEIISQFLEASEIEATIITDSPEAIAKISDFKPRVIILDIMMPKLDGLTLLKKIRDRKEWSDIKIIVYTAKNFDVDKRKALQLGADLFLAKPTRGFQIVEHVKSLAGVPSLP